MSWSAFGRGVGAALTSAGQGVRDWVLFKADEEQKNKVYNLQMEVKNIEKTKMANEKAHQDAMLKLAESKDGTEMLYHYLGYLDNQLRTSNEFWYQLQSLTKQQSALDLQAGEASRNLAAQKDLERYRTELQEKMLPLLQQREKAGVVWKGIVEGTVYALDVLNKAHTDIQDQLSKAEGEPRVALQRVETIYNDLINKYYNILQNMLPTEPTAQPFKAAPQSGTDYIGPPSSVVPGGVGGTTGKVKFGPDELDFFRRRSQARGASRPTPFSPIGP